MFTKYKYFLFTENPDELVKFYLETLEMKLVKKLDLPMDYGYTIEAAPGYEIWIAKHSEVNGINKEPVRHMINLYTDELQRYFDKVKDVAGVKILQQPVSMGNFVPDETRYVCTFLDPEGNCIQLMGKV